MKPKKELVLIRFRALVLFVTTMTMSFGLVFMADRRASPRGERNMYTKWSSTKSMTEWLDTCSSLRKCLEMCQVLHGETVIQSLPDIQMLSPIFSTKIHGDYALPLDMDGVLAALNGYDAYVNSRKSGTRSTSIAKARCSTMAAMSDDHTKNSVKMKKTAIVIVADGVPGVALNASLEDKHQYANRWGYDVVTHKKLEASRATPWSKIPALLSVMHMYEYVWSLDLDTVIMNHDIAIETLFDDRFEFVLTVDSNGINSGSGIIKSSDWVRGFLTEAWTIHNLHMSQYWWEQAAFMNLFENYPLRNHAKLIHQNFMNAYPTEEGPFTNTFVLHLPGRRDDKWTKLLKFIAHRNLGSNSVS